MNNKEITTNDNPNEILKKIVDQHGIDTINEFVKTYNKQLRKQQKRVNYYDEIAISVYELVHEENYSKTRAIDKVAEENNINFNTVRNHCAKFDKEAKEFDYCSFAVSVDNQNAYSPTASTNEMICRVAQLNKLDPRVARIYYNKYHKDKKKIKKSH